MRKRAFDKELGLDDLDFRELGNRRKAMRAMERYMDMEDCLEGLEKFESLPDLMQDEVVRKARELFPAENWTDKDFFDAEKRKEIENGIVMVPFCYDPADEKDELEEFDLGRKYVRKNIALANINDQLEPFQFGEDELVEKE